MTSSANGAMSDAPRLRVLIVGAGLSGLCIANSLLRDPAQRFDVSVFERDTVAFDSERGGYQIRLGQDGITGLKTCLSPETYLELSQAWGQGAQHNGTLRPWAYLITDVILLLHRIVASTSHLPADGWHHSCQVGRTQIVPSIPCGTAYRP